MADTPNPAPAGAGAAPARSMNESEGIAALLAMEAGGRETEIPAETEPLAGGEGSGESPEAEEPEAPLAGGEEGDPGEGEPEEGTEPAPGEAEPQAPEGDDETIHGNKYVVLRDGSKERVGVLKQSHEELAELRRHIPQVQQRLAQADQREREFAAERQQLQPILAQVESILQGQIPAPATDDLWQSDPIEAAIRDRAHQKAVQQLQQVNQAHAQQQQRAAAEQQQRERAAINGAAQIFFQARPELRTDKTKHDAYVQDFVSVAEMVGFRREDLGRITDPRLYALGELAIEGMKARQARTQQSQTRTQTAALAARKVAGKPPVAAPAARQSPGAYQASRVRTAKDALRKNPNSMDAAVAAIQALDE